MLPEDIKRLDRERSIAEARRGPDYRDHENAVRAVKAAYAKRFASQREDDARHDRAYRQWLAHYYAANYKQQHRRSPTPRRPYVPEM